MFPATGISLARDVRVFAQARAGFSAGLPGLSGLESFSAKLLTSRIPVISFRPADVNCGKE
jgi:hypothetical protein